MPVIDLSCAYETTAPSPTRHVGGLAFAVLRIHSADRGIRTVKRTSCRRPVRFSVHLPDGRRRVAQQELAYSVDNSVILTQPPEFIFEEYFRPRGFRLPAHSFRDIVLDEFLEVSRLGLDDQNRIFEQLNHYAIDCPEILQEKPYWSAILLRDHRLGAVRAMSEIWAGHVLRYSRRDQLSVNMAFRQSGLTPDVMPIDNFSSWFHTWPCGQGRNRDKGTRNPAVSLSPPAVRVRQLEQELAELARRHEQGLAERAHDTSSK